MKKFFSLVLALVMALSLTTVAWGVPTTKTVGPTGCDFTTLDAALTAVKDTTGDVVIEISGVVEYSGSSPSLSNKYSSITFVGKTEDAEIRMTRNGSNGYMSGTGSAPVVKFQDLILSKPGGSWAGDAGHMSVFFTVYRVAEVHYTNCVFPDGACASGCKTTYTECEFANTTSGEYSLWVYGNADVTVTGGEFTGVRGVKMYAEGRGKNSDLVMEDVVFTDSVTEKPAVVLTFGGSVELSGNTYPEKGMFELSEGSDADPNGTTIIADVDDISCTSDSQADCGVLVDGKIYKNLTEADAAGVITTTSTVDLFYNSTETVDLPETVTLNKNGYLAAGVMKDTASTDKYDLHQANAAGTKLQTGFKMTPMASVKNADGTGTIAYYETSNGNKMIEIPVSQAKVTDYYITAVAGTTPIKYLREVAVVDYTYTATAFTNLGTACEQVNNTLTPTKDYYVVSVGAAKDTVYMEGTTGAYALVGNEIVQLNATPATKNAHTWVASGMTKGVVTSAVCAKCGAPAAVYTSISKIPAGSAYVTLTTALGANGEIYVVPAGAAVVPTTPSTDKVTSADTFDAGIAMYVGMSVMAAAGSAVVLKKRED